MKVVYHVHFALRYDKSKISKDVTRQLSLEILLFYTQLESKYLNTLKTFGGRTPISFPLFGHLIAHYGFGSPSGARAR